ncbi:lysosome-associated membrane glycoprotein 2 isoform 2-T2 [Odontesthes bonariensis]|uniref:lysosome-associated membrane glycoprotein 2 isoform X2 n=1 Tax=Odontesthes bonariensis TaxID=219752 RepID=UPI003F58A542
MSRHAALVLLAFGLVFQMSHGIEVNVTKDNKLCLYANLMLNLSVSYEVAANKSQTIEFELPADAKPGDSKCEDASSTLMLKFGEGHSWSVNFTLKDKVYQADVITFTYNLNDSTVFPNSQSNETLTVTEKPHTAHVPMDTCFSCKSKEVIEADKVNMTLWDVLIQAFVTNGSKSENITSCAADVPTTQVPPTTHVTSTTTAAPVTNTTSTAPPATTTPMPTPTLPTPTIGKYSLKTDENGTTCLLANFGLRIAFMQGKKYQEMNFEPNGTQFSGFCGANSSELVLVSDDITIKLTFANDTKKFRLHALNVTAKTNSGVFVAANTNLSLWEASVGSSYMCNKEQNHTITSLLTIYTFNLQVQPFGVTKDVFSTAEECFLDSDLSFLVPIAVGVALSFLIILVLISYLIGRRKSRTGYQSV